MLGGIAVAVRIPWWVVVVPFVAIGLVLAAREVDWERLRHPRSQSAVVIACVGVAGFGAVALIEALVGFRFLLHPWDDMRAYLPLATRLVDTNALIEPWSARRLQNLGGFTFLQAMPVAIFGDTGIGIIETMLASIFLAGLFIANGFRSTWARVLSVGFILAVPLLWVPRINTTGVLMGTPLLVAVLAVTVELRVSLRAANRRAAARWAVAGGLLTTALYSVRPNLAVLAIGFLVVGAGLATGARVVERVRVVAVGGAAAFVALIPWSIASWQAVDTPLFPVFTGNQNLAAIRTAPARGVLHVADDAFGLVRSGPYVWMAIGVVVVALVCHKLLPDAPFVAIAAGLTAVAIVAFALQEHSAGRIAFVRYIAPMSLGLAVFFVIELIRGLDVRPVLTPAATSDRVVPVLAVSAAILIAAVGFSGLALSLEYGTLPGGASLVDRGCATSCARRRASSWPGRTSRRPSCDARTAAALRNVDPDRTIAAVDRPYLIDYGRYDIPSLDLPGFTAPGGDFPFFSGPEAKIARLRRAGFDTLLVTVPADEIALNPALLQFAETTRVPPYSKYMRNYLDWENDVTAIAAAAPGAVRHIGPLMVIDLRRAQRALAGAASGPSG